MADYLNSNVFSMGKSSSNMLGSIDVISLNSWGEWHCHHFEGQKALLDTLAFITPGMKRASQDVAMEVISCSSKLRSQTERSVKNLLDRTVRLSRGAQESSTLVYPLKVGKIRYGIFFNNRGMHFENLSDAKSFYQQLSKKKLVEIPRPELGNEPFSKIPSVIQDYAARGAIQYFLRQRSEGLDVFILDENNALNHYVQEEVDIEGLVSQVSHHHAFNDSILEREQFNMPQFFKLERLSGKLVALPFGVSKEAYEVEF